jgi:protein TonB
MNDALKGSLPRYAPALLIAVLVNILLFFMMQMMISGDDRDSLTLHELPVIDYVRQQEERIDTQRARKPPPPKPEEPEPPKIEKLAVQTPTEITPIAPVPPMKLSPAPDLGGPYLGEMGAPQWINAGDLVALVRIPPEYPAHARMRRIQGYVDVEFTVDTEGRVRNARVVNAEPQGVFDRAALNSISHWRFEPKRRDGQPVEVLARQRIAFELN